MYNVFEAVDVITLIKGGVYDDLNLSVGEALKKRSPVSDSDSVILYRLLTAGRTFLESIPARSMTALTLSLTPSASPGFTG